MTSAQSWLRTALGDDEPAQRSIYDAPDEAASADCDPWDDDRVPDGAGEDPAAAMGWAAAPRACVDRFIAAAAAAARLDERLRLMAPDARRAALTRLAIVQAARLMWGEGEPVDPWALALDAARRQGRAGGEAPAMTRAHRLARRLVAPRTPQDRWPADIADPAPASHGFLRAAALESALRREGAVAMADAAVAAMRLAALAARRSPDGGLRFAPLPARRRAARPEPAARLAAFLADLADGAADAQAALDDVAAWRAHADAVAAAMKGSTPARLVDLLAQRLAVGAPDAAQALGLSDSAAGRALERLAAAGVARELTGQGRFRAWGALL
jgi:hypothetical protein